MKDNEVYVGDIVSYKRKKYVIDGLEGSNWAGDYLHLRNDKGDTVPKGGLVKWIPCGEVKLVWKGNGSWRDGLKQLEQLKRK